MSNNNGERAGRQASEQRCTDTRGSARQVSPAGTGTGPASRPRQPHQRNSNYGRGASSPRDSVKLVSPYAEGVIMLVELFPTWGEEDLAALLGELNGDVELACNRIADGHAKPWEPVGKKVPKQQQPRARRDEGSWSSSSKRADGDQLSWSAPGAATSSDSLGWGVQEPPKADALGCGIEEPPKVQATAADSLAQQADGLGWGFEEPPKASLPKDEAVPVPTKEEDDLAAEMQRVVAITEEETIIVVQTSIVVEEEEDDVYVRLPKMSARKQAALEIEPSAVLLPVSVPIRTGVAFGSAAASSKLVFGESKAPVAPAVVAPTTPVVSPTIAATAQKVYSPEELFASAVRPNANYASTSPTATTAVDTSATPPGLTKYSSGNNSLERRGHHQQHHQQQHHYQQQQYYGGQRYDAYGQQQQYQQQQRYTPYSSQPLEDAYASGNGASTYYPAAASGRHQAAANAAYYYGQPLPQHHAYAMYASDPYGAAVAAGAFAPQQQQPQPQAGTRYQHQHQAPSAATPSGSASQQQQQQPPYNSPGGSTRSRMF